MVLASLCSFSLQQRTFSLAITMGESPQASGLCGVWGIQLWLWALWFRSVSHCKTTVMLWADQEAAEPHPAVTGLEAGMDLLQRRGGRQVSFPSPHPIAQGGCWTQRDAGAAEPCCPCFGEDIEKLLALVGSWKYARCYKKGIIACTSSWQRICFIRGSLEQSPCSTLLSMIQKDMVVLSTSSGKAQQTGKLWRAVSQRESAG